MKLLKTSPTTDKVYFVKINQSNCKIENKSFIYQAGPLIANDFIYQEVQIKTIRDIVLNYIVLA